MPMSRPRMFPVPSLPVLFLGGLLLAVVGWLQLGRAECCLVSAIMLPGLPSRREFSTPFATALGDWLESGEPAEALGEALVEDLPETDEDFAAVAEYFVRVRDPSLSAAERRRLLDALPEVVDCCLDIEGDDHHDAVSEWLLPPVVALFEELLVRRGRREQRSALLLLEILLSFNENDVVDRLVRAVRRPLLPDDPAWDDVFSNLDGDHPFWMEIRDALADPLPPDSISGAFLDAMNRLAFEGELDWHPFASEAGCKRIAQWYAGRRPEDLDLARIGTAALACFDRALRQDLLDMARRHPHPSVAIEANWVAALTGDESGVTELAKWALERDWSVRACQYLQELERADAIPDGAREPNFVALASLSAWFSSNIQYGVPPRRVELCDRRVLYWPPFEEEKEFFLVRYELLLNGECISGVAMVGSIIHALPQMPTDGLSPEDVYGLYCAWEMDRMRDPDDSRPPAMTIAQARELIARHNPDFPAVS